MMRFKRTLLFLAAAGAVSLPAALAAQTQSLAPEAVILAPEPGEVLDPSDAFVAIAFIDPATVAAVRAKVKDRDTFYMVPELMKEHPIPGWEKWKQGDTAGNIYE